MGRMNVISSESTRLEKALRTVPPTSEFSISRKVERRGLPDWIWKPRAIQQAARELRDSLNSGFLHTATFVPVPPSRTTDDPLYDDRMTQVLRALGPNIDVRELF